MNKKKEKTLDEIKKEIKDLDIIDQIFLLLLGLLTVIRIMKEEKKRK